MADDSSLHLLVRDIQTGRQWAFVPGDGGASCPVLEKQLTGDGPVSWSYSFTQYQDVLPPRFAHVDVLDDQGLVQTARVVLSTPPSTADCSGTASITARGYNEALADRKFSASTIFGPRWQWQIDAENPTIGITADDAIRYAVSQLGGSVGEVAVGPTIDVSEDFIGHPAMDVVNTMSACRGGLATPYVWSVKRGVFTWGPLDLGARYQVQIGDGVTFAPTDDASHLYNRVIVIYRSNHSVVYPAVGNYEKIPTTVDLVVNAGAEINDRASAQSLAESLYGKLQTLELGWTGELTIDGDAPIEALGAGYIYPWRVETQKMMRMAGLDAAARYGRNIPGEMLVSNARWDGPNNSQVLSLGELRDPSKVSRLIYETIERGNSKPWVAYAYPGLNIPKPDMDKLKSVPPIPTENVAADDGGVGVAPHPLPASQTGYGIPAVDHKQETVDPTAVPPHPPEIAFQINDADLAGVKGISWVQPVRLTQYSISASASCTVTVTGRLVSTNALLITLQLVAQSQKLNQTITPAISPLVTIGAHPTFADIVARDGIKWEVTVADAALESTETESHYVSIGIGSVRYFPGYANSAPVAGGKI